MMGRNDQLPHTLVPLVLAVTIVRSKLSDSTLRVPSEPNAIATFIASAVPIWEYSDDARQPPKPLQNPVPGGIFRDGGRELMFLDGRASKSLLAVHVNDIDCVVEMLKHPERALCIRNRVIRQLARRLVERSRSLRTRTSSTLNKARRLQEASRRQAPETSSH